MILIDTKAVSQVLGIGFVIAVFHVKHTVALAYSIKALTVLVTTIDAQWEGMWVVGSARYEPALLPPCPTIRVLSYSN